MHNLYSQPISIESSRDIRSRLTEHPSLLLKKLFQMSKLQIRNHPLQKMSQHLHSPHKLKLSLNNSQKMPLLLSSSKKAKPARLSRPKTIPLPHCNRKTNPFLNNDNNTLLIHLHLAKIVPVHFQIIVKNSNCLQQKIPVRYQRN